MGTDYSLHIASSPSVKAGRNRLSPGPVFREYVILQTTDLEPRLSSLYATAVNSPHKARSGP